MYAGIPLPSPLFISLHVLSGRMAVQKFLVFSILASPCLWAQAAGSASPAPDSPATPANSAGVPVASAQGNNVSKETTETETATHTPPDAATMLQLQRDVISSLQDLNTALRNVSDKESADAAADKAGKACTRILELTRMGKSYGRPDAETAALLERDASRSGRSLEDHAKTALSRILTIYFHNCHGSELLRDAVQPFMEEMLEGADALEQGTPLVPDVPDVAQPE